jgi:hypothetical protein
MFTPKALTFISMELILMMIVRTKTPISMEVLNMILSRKGLI